MKSGPDGNDFVKNLVNSFTVGGECLAVIVYGQDCCSKMIRIKKTLRKIWAEDVAKNVMHCSDNKSKAIFEITSLLH